MSEGASLDQSAFGPQPRAWFEVVTKREYTAGTRVPRLQQVESRLDCIRNVRKGEIGAIEESEHFSRACFRLDRTVHVHRLVRRLRGIGVFARIERRDDINGCFLPPSPARSFRRDRFPDDDVRLAQLAGG